MSDPVVLSAEDLNISNSGVSDAAMHVVKGLKESGYEAYLVGGCIRDLILEQKPKDFDVSTNASPEQVRSTFKDCRIIGRRFRIAHVRFKREIIEVSTFRGNPKDKENASRHEMREGKEGQLVRDNVFGTRDEDAFRRDFTINALYYDPIEEKVLDYMDSVSDIKAGKLSTIGDEQSRFIEDPVRMLRMIRFAAKLDFKLEDHSIELIKEHANLLTHVSAPRMFEEVLKLFHGGKAVRSFEMLRGLSLFKTMFPFTAQHIVDGEPGFPERALANTDARICAGKPVIPAFLFACLLWDPVREDANQLMDSGNNVAKAWKIAMTDAIRDQSQYVALPRRLADVIIDIWMLQFRMVKRQPSNIFQIMNDRRFRAAYDFMLLRAELNEVDQEVADWWTDIQEMDEIGKKSMVAELRDSSDDDDDDEPNFNTFHHAQNGNAKGNVRNKNARQNNHSNKGGRGRNKRGQNNPNNPHAKKHAGGAKRGKRRSNKGKGRHQSNDESARQMSGSSVDGNAGDGNQENKKSGPTVKHKRSRVSKTSRSNPYRSRNKNNKEAPIF